jgi:hypothetical protein
MLTIRKEQMEIFSQKMLERFADQAAKTLKSNFDALTNKIPEPDLLAMVHAGITRAGTYGITYEKDVMQYLEYAIRFGADFDTDPTFSGIHEILKKEVDGTMKILLINEYIESFMAETR